MGRHTDRAAFAVTALVAVPVAGGMLWAGAGTVAADAAVAGAFLVAWLVCAFPVAVLTGRWIARRWTTPHPEECDDAPAEDDLR